MKFARRFLLMLVGLALLLITQLAAPDSTPVSPTSALAQTPAACQAPQRLGVTFVIDDSGSMYTDWADDNGLDHPASDPDLLRAAATRAGLDRLADGYVASVIAFGNDTTEALPPTQLDATSRATAEQAVGAALDNHGGTDYDAAFDKAWQEHLAMPASVDRQAVIFLSDGRPNSTFSEDTQFASAGIPIYTLGLGSGVDEGLMRGISSRSGGAYFKLDSAADIAPVFGSIVSSLTCDQSAAQLGQDLAPGQSVSVPFTVGPDDSNVQGLASWDSGDVTVKLVRPDGSIAAPGIAGIGETFNTDPNYTSFALDTPRPGNWQVVVTAGSQAYNVNVNVQVFKRQAYIDPGAPQPNPDPTCQHQLILGPVTVIASCLRANGSTLVADGRVRLNGIDLNVVPNQGQLVFDPSALSVQATGQVKVQVGPITAYQGAFSWTITPSLNIALGAGVTLKGLPLSGSIDATWTPGGATLVAHASLGPDFGNITGDIALQATNDLGVKVSNLSLSLADGDLKLFNELVLKSASLTYDGSQDLWHGAAEVGLPGGKDVAGSFGIQGGRFHDASASADGLNIPLGEALFVQKIGLGVSVNPLKLSGQLGFTAGPSLSVFGHDLSALEGDGSFSWQNGSRYDTWTLGGSMKLASFELGNASVTYRPGLDLSFGGNLKLQLARAGFSGNASGWIEGLHRFEAKGSGTISMPALGSVSAQGLVSNRGVAVCGTRKVLFGSISAGASLAWGGNPHLFTGDCDFSSVEVQRSAQAARITQAGRTASAIDLTLHQARSPLLFAVHGKSGAPQVTMRGPGIGAADNAGGASLTKHAYLVESPDESTTYIVVDHAKRGRYRFTVTGGPAMTRVGAIPALPKPLVTASVHHLPGQRLRLSWHLRSVAGQNVAFIERGAGVAHTLTTTTQSRGSVVFTPTSGIAGTRQVIAVVTQRGLPRLQRRVAIFLVHADHPLPVGKLRVGGTKTFTVFWSRRGKPLSYDVVVTLPDGRHILRVSGPKATNAHFPSIVVGTHGTVTVTTHVHGTGARSATKRF